ncbi:hypothetical protein [Paenibacillus sanguinis]|uniref:hypothetical protein n=1 Tax=Paenibacillus sanguinis TaxID=225906 RepID=UPI000365C9A7|nr:hypothetical protein [Paenibacillus sanguinis]
MFEAPWVFIVLLGVAALVYALLLPRRQVAESPKADAAREVEATLEQYMAEIEKENEELMGMVAQMKQDFTGKQLAGQELMVELRQRLSEVEVLARQSDSRLLVLESALQRQEFPVADVVAEQVQPLVAVAIESPESPVIAEVQPDPVSPVAEEPQDEHVRDRYPELFDLYAQGKSMDMIAKTVGLQRGEVQLILQLARKEESP